MPYITTGLTPDASGHAGVTSHYHFSYDSTLMYDAVTNPTGPEPARTNALIAAAESDYTIVSNWFGGGLTVTGMIVKVTTGSNGASWGGGTTGATINLNPGGASYTNNPIYLRYLLVAEVCEIFMMAQAWSGKWFYGTSTGGNEGSKGEGLSRFMGGQLLAMNGALGIGIDLDYAVANNWLNSPRTDYINTDPDIVGDDMYSGCTTLFIYYLFTQLGYTIPQIVAAGSSTMAGVYANLTGDTSDPFPLFKSLLDAAYPSHTTSAVPAPNYDDPWPLPKVYITGGYQSPDIIITNLTTGMPVPVGGAPGGPWDTLLSPSTDYGFSAVVHNISNTDAAGVQVSFWSIPGGLAVDGTMVGTPQTVTIPANSSVTVNASAHFVSGAAGQHTCAAVSLYSPGTGCSVNATTATQIPNPAHPGIYGCSAWRNTDSMMGAIGSKFKFHLGLGHLPAELKKPLPIQIHSIHVPANWSQLAKVKEIENTLNFVGAAHTLPLYMLPEVHKTFNAIHLNTRVTAPHASKVDELAKNVWHFMPHSHKAEGTTFEVSGEIPETARKGDILLVKVTAHYPAKDKVHGRAVEFLQVIHVK